MHRLGIATVAVGLVACGEGPDPGSAADRCGNNAPTFETLTVTDDGETDASGRRIVAVAASASDADGDLHRYTVEIFADTFLDGNLEGSALLRVSGEAGTDDSCVVGNTTPVTVGAYLPFGEIDGLAFGERIEIGMVLFDAAGNRSQDPPELFETVLPEE